MKKKILIAALLLCTASLCGCDSLVKTAENAISSGAKVISEDLSAAKNELDDAIGELGEAAGEVGNAAGEVMGELGEAAGSIAGAVGEELGDAANAIGGAVNGAVEEASEAIGGVLGSAQSEQIIFTDGFDTFSYAGDIKGDNGERIVCIKYEKNQGYVPYEIIDTREAMFFADNMHTGRYECINKDNSGKICVPANKQAYDESKNIVLGEYESEQYIKFIYKDSDGNTELYDESKYNGNTEFKFCGEFSTNSLMTNAAQTGFDEQEDKKFTFVGTLKYAKMN